MNIFRVASKKEGGVFVVGLVMLFIVLALGTFAYLQNIGGLKEYKINLFSAIGPDKTIMEEPILPKEKDLSIGITTSDEKDKLSDLFLPSPEPTGEYIFEAQKGEGVTHVARRAVSKYISEKEIGMEMTAEHRIYAEDYIQKHIGQDFLKLGEKVNISESLVREAVEKSQELTESQLENLKQFSQLVNW